MKVMAWFVPMKLRTRLPWQLLQRAVIVRWLRFWNLVEHTEG